MCTKYLRKVKSLVEISDSYAIFKRLAIRQFTSGEFDSNHEYVNQITKRIFGNELKVICHDQAKSLMQAFNQEHKIQTQSTNGLCSNWKRMRCIEIQTPTMSATNPSGTMPLFEAP